MESKVLQHKDYQPHPEDKTELMLTFKLLPLVHLLFIGSFMRVASLSQESKVCSPYSADLECFKPHLLLMPKLEKLGWLWRDGGAQRAHPPSFVVKKNL